MQIHSQLIAALGGLLLLSFSNDNGAQHALQITDTTGKGFAYRQASFITQRPSITFSHTLADLNTVLAQKQAAGIQLGITRQGRPVNAWYFPGISDKKALVIGGVHGSELSSIEVAQTLVEKLLNQEEQTYYSVIIIPSLFPDNAAKAMRMPEQLGSVLNIGRYTHETAVDPNRQMPSPGEDLDDVEQTDHLKRPIERENQYLLQLIRMYKPERIASVHAIRNINYGGIYADPRTDSQGIALGYDTDSSLAVDMARFVHAHNGNVAGNRLDKQPTALYYKDPEPAPEGFPQKRNTTGAALKGNRGSGISMGTWGTTAIENKEDPDANRPAMRVITIEVPGARRSFDYKTAAQRSFFRNQIEAFANSILEVFLAEKYVE